MSHAAQTTRPGAARGFTLVEMLIVISILVILVAMIISVANAVKVGGAEQQVRGYLGVLMSQVNSYHDLTGKYPAHWPGYDPNAWNAGDNTVRTNIARLNCGVLMCGTGGLLPAGGTLKATGGLESIDAVYTALRENIPSSLLEPPAGTANPTGDLDGPGPGGAGIPFRYLNDGFGDHMPFNYLSNGGPGGTPVIISAGPDRQWGTADDIRSDERQ